MRQYEIRIRKAVDSQMHGDYHSVFKGSGLEFDDVRQYQYGDDVRAIDWNVSAKGHGTFIKTFKEEKEQNVFFVIDVSASQNIGREGIKKMDVAKEICSVLALSAVKEGSSVGFLCFSDQKEKYIKPDKGMKHAYQSIGALFKMTPKSPLTDIDKGLGQAMGVVKRKSVVIVVSDFIGEGYDRKLKAIGQKHDAIAIHLADKRESKLPNLGIVPMLDKETGRTFWANTSWGAFKNRVSGFLPKSQEHIKEVCRQSKINYLFVDTGEDFVPKLVQLFKTRNKSRK